MTDKDKAVEQSNTAGAAKGGNTSASGLMRYDFDWNYGDPMIAEDQDGEYVKFSDVERLLAQAGVRAEPAEQELVPGIAYPTTYADLARLTPLQLWNRWYPQDRSISAREAFIAARQIPCAPTTPAQVPAAEVRAQALAEVRAEVRHMQNHLETYGPAGEEAARVALDGVLDIIEEIEDSYASTADKASEVRAAVQKLFDAVEKGAAPFKVEYALDQLEGDEVQLGIDPGYVRDIFTAAGLIAAPSTADSGNTSALGEGADRG